uniref:LysR-type regulatory protein n=1 Tax=Cupriavidus necator TaxID=106590 RepID=UPI000C81099C|nr:Chain A, LysR-type regulatory protein [Cupriavidus necator]5XXP_B Chain B, LysR-type regulatory protein [Cupriavidus necator]
MEFRQLKYFIAVAEAGNMAAAAKRLHVSQPPITRQMQALEADLGVVLLERSHRGIELTAAGHAFLEDARRILELAGRSGDRSRAAARENLYFQGAHHHHHH